MRSADYKLVEWFENGRTELYDLRQDPGETVDLSAKRPEQAAALYTLLETWRNTVDARMPRPNPEYR